MTDTTAEATRAVDSIQETTGPVKRQLPHPEKSRAIQINQFGETSLFTLAEVTTPVIQGPHDVIVKVNHTSVNPIDWKVRKGFMSLLEKPTFPHTLGKDFSGTIVAKGNGVSRFFINDKVFGVAANGAYAEYVRVNTERDIIEKKPVSVPSDEAAGAPLASLAAWHALVELGNLPVGEKAAEATPKVLIIGASGGVGTFAIQLAKKVNHANVTAISSGKNAELVKKLGADRFINYETEKFEEVLKDQQDFDLVVDLVGDEGNYKKTSTLLKKNGVYAAVATEINDQPLTIGDLAKFGATVVGRKVFGSRTYKPLLDVERKDFPKIIPFLERREIKTVINKTFSLEKVSEAHTISETTHASGKLIIKVDHPQ